MKAVNNFYYICEKGHLTTGETDRKKKCPMPIREMKMTKKGKELIRERSCDGTLVEVIPIPQKLDYFDVWDYKKLKAFMTDQTAENLKIEFLNDLQKIFVGMKTKIDNLETQIKDIKDGNK